VTDCQVEIDLDAYAAYISLTDNAVTRSVEVTPDVIVDLDDMAVVVGIEVLALDADIPHAELVTKFHVHSEVIDALDLIRPSVGTYFRLALGSDGAIEAGARNNVLQSA
jgi:uncharacterized protein YuzE